MSELLLDLDTAIEAEATADSTPRVRELLTRLSDEVLRRAAASADGTATLTDEEWLLIPSDQRAGMVALWVATVRAMIQ